MAGLATTAILAHNCEIDMTQSKETYGLYLFYFHSDECGPVDLRILGIDVDESIPLPEFQGKTDAVERTFVFAIVSVALHGALAVTTVLLFGTMCISCLGRSCVVVGFYPWILAMFLVLALDVTGFVTYLIDFINVMDLDGVIELLELDDTPIIRQVLGQVDDIYFIAPSLFMWLAFSKAVVFWFMFLLFLAVIISLSMTLWKENKPAPTYHESMQPRQVMHPTSPPADREDTQNAATRYFDQAPQQQHPNMQHQPVHDHQHLPRIYPPMPPPNQLQLPHSDPNVRRSMEPLNDSCDSSSFREDSIPYISTPAQESPVPMPLHVKQTIDPFHDKRFSYLPGQPAPFSYLAGPPSGNSPRSSVTAPPEVRNQLPWSYFPATDDKKPPGKRFTSTLTEEKDFPGEEKQLPTHKAGTFPDDRSSVTTDEGKWSGPEYKYYFKISNFCYFQSLIWIGFAITGIIAYYCDIDFSGQSSTMGSLLTLTFFNVYFRGTCVQQDIPPIDMSLVQPLNLMPPGDVHAFVWVYLIIHLFWGISSLTLLTNARHKYVRYINVFLYIWIIITMIISVLDLALGILFAIDYDTVVHALFEYPFDMGQLLPAVQVLATAVHVSGIMMVMAFRGWIFWVVNVSLAIFMFTQTFKIYDYNQMRRKQKSNGGGRANGGYVTEGDTMQRPPIDAYDMSQPRTQFAQPVVTEYRRPLERISEGPIPVESPVPPQQDWSQQRSFEPKPTVVVNRTLEPLARPQSNEPEERPIDNRPIPPPPPPKNFMNTVVRRDVAAAKVARELNYRNSFNVNNNGIAAVNLRPTGLNLTNPGPLNGETDLPTPNYSPPMPRTNPFENRPPLRSVLRNSRFQ
uniref:Uncharacterized protein n=1 Tax=Anopheles christyi TaxID=43041 RepID=A0A182K925_9DIPT